MPELHTAPALSRFAAFFHVKCILEKNESEILGKQMKLCAILLSLN